MRSRLECLLTAIAQYNRSGIPTDAAFHANNPLRLGKYANGVATGELRKFKTLHSGIVAGLFDLEVKANGKSRAKLSGEDFTIRGLMRVYSLRDGTEKYVAKFLRQALNDDTITENTKLDFFIENTNGRS